MTIREIEIDGVGPLASIRLGKFAPGLNVVLTRNYETQAGLLECVRTLLQDVSTGERPPSGVAKRGRSAGALVLEHDNCEFVVRRLQRTDHCDTLAVCANGRSVDHFSACRRAWRAAGEGPLASLFFGSRPRSLSAHEAAQWVEALVRLQSMRAQAARVAADACAPSHSALRDAEQRCDHLRREAASIRRTQHRRQRSRAAELHQLNRSIESAIGDVERLDQTWQATVTDLHELEDRLWSLAETPASPESIIDRAVSGDVAANIRQVLLGLAERRKQLTMTLAELTCGPPTSRPGAARTASLRAEAERHRIDRCETELLHQLQCLAPVLMGGGPTGRATYERTTISSSPPIEVPDGRSAMQSRLGALTARAATLAAQLASTRQHHCQLLTRRDRLERERRRAAVGDRTLDLRRFALAVARQQLTSLEMEQASVELFRGALEQSVPCPPNCASIAAAASQNLAALSAGRWPRVDYRDETDQWHIADDCGTWHPLETCPARAAEQASFALRMALVESARRYGPVAPVVWDDVLAEWDDEEVRCAGQLLFGVAGRGVQIVLVTDRPRVAALLAEAGAMVHELPEPAARTSVVSEHFPERQIAESPAPEPHSEPDDCAALPVRVHPAPSHWLIADRGLHEVPSVGPQMARQLRRMGVFDVGDLLTLELSSNRFLLSELQLTADQVRLWQAEAEILCRVPDLTGRDAQLLVSCGVLTPEELAGFSPSDLAGRIDRLRGGAATRWLPDVGVWPRRETVLGWIRSARQARSIEAVLQEGDRWNVRAARPPGAISPVRHTDHDGWPADGGHPALHPNCPVAEAPCVGQKAARLLERIGIVSISDLIACDPAATARRLRHPRLSADVLRAWQRHSELLCAVPGLRPSDARLLVACGVHDAQGLRRIAPSTLFAIVGPFLETEEGRRILRGDTPPTIEDASRWVEASHRARMPRAA